MGVSHGGDALEELLVPLREVRRRGHPRHRREQRGHPFLDSEDRVAVIVHGHRLPRPRAAAPGAAAAPAASPRHRFRATATPRKRRREERGE
jgi:hypothetical protein